MRGLWEGSRIVRHIDILFEHADLLPNSHSHPDELAEVNSQTTANVFVLDVRPEEIYHHNDNSVV